ncbi:MAG: hypothetical protein M3Y39_19155 [Chloroflexota bacterium]|nr:hypothetical protein [Chloroflexota bacterium]
MQNNQYVQELSDEDLELVVGGTHHHHHHHSTPPSTGVNVGGYANGGHFDEVVAMTESFTVDYGRGKSASFSFGFAFAVAV